MQESTWTMLVQRNLHMLIYSTYLCVRGVTEKQFLKPLIVLQTF